MILKILLLAGAAAAVWALTRPRGRSKPPPAVGETAMEQCGRCGVYHPAGDLCKCEKNGKAK